jgi:antitoxin YefM
MGILPLATVKNRLSEIITSVVQTHDRVVITRNGSPVAVLISVEELESLEETLEVMSAPELMASIRQGEADLAAGRFVEGEEAQKVLKGLV